MSMQFTKLFSSITESTIWVAPDAHRICWITMLAMADSLGRVWGSVPGLANRARISVEDARSALASFLSPDADSRTKDHEGRRIEEIDGGWRLLNHAKYRAIRDDEAIREAKRKYINTRRAIEREAGVDNVDRSRSKPTAVDRGRHIAEADTEAEVEKTPPPAKAAGDPDGFADFWNSWPASPRKLDRKKCAAKWQRGGFAQKLPLILAHVETAKQSKQWRDGFEPAPLTYINGERWADGEMLEAEPHGAYL